MNLVSLVYRNLISEDEVHKVILMYEIIQPTYPYSAAFYHILTSNLGCCFIDS